MFELKSFGKLRSLTGIKEADYRRLVRDVQQHYKSFDSKLGTGKWRHIDSPKEDLGSAQERVLRRVLTMYPLPTHMYGAKKGASIVEHAKVHARRECVLTVDLRNCYPRTSYKQVYSVFIERLGCSPDIASVLTKLCTLNHHLPQGASTSGYVAHLVLVGLYEELRCIADRHRLRLSFYMDDIAMSGSRPAVTAAMDATFQAIHKRGHSIRSRKKRLMEGDEQEVTGLRIHDGLQVPRSYLERVEGLLIGAAQAGTVAASQYDSLKGMIGWVRSVNREQAAPLEELFAFVGQGSQRTKVFPTNVPCRSKAACRWWKENREQYR